jgi:signal transduction histidine kinase
MSGQALLKKYPELRWIYWITHIGFIVTIGLFLLTAWYVQDFLDFKKYVVLFTFFPIRSITNAVIAIVSGVYPLERFRKSTVFFIGEQSTKKVATKQIIVSSLMVLTIILAYFYL